MFESEFDKFSIMFESGTESSNMFAIGGNVKLRSYNTSTKYEPLDVIYEAQQEVRYLLSFEKIKLKQGIAFAFIPFFFFTFKADFDEIFFFSEKFLFFHISLKRRNEF